ncbi:MAG: hypothetical protein AB2A00_12400 [Myxococcota bacterium]
MPQSTKDLALGVQAIVSEAMAQVRGLIRETLHRELGNVIPDGERKARAGRGAVKARKTTARRKATGRAVSGEKLDALVKLVSRQGEVVPKEARKTLKLTPAQMQVLARQAAAQKMIGIRGAGRGTRYVKR